MSKDLVFIASGGRTGTTFFGERLRTVIEGCWSEHEPDTLSANWQKSLARMRRFGLWHMVFGRLVGVAGLRPLGHRLLIGSIPEDECLRRLREQRARYHASISESLIVESSGRWWMFADRIHHIWPEAKLVGIVRDPRDWIESWRRYQPNRQTLGWLRWFPLGPLTPRAVGDLEWADQWERFDQFGRLAWDWRMIYGQLDRASSVSHNVRIFRFEDLFGPDDDAVRQLVEFAGGHARRQYRVLDLKGFTAEVHNASSGSRRHWREWPADSARLVEELCGPLMRKFGYGTEPEWQRMIAG